MEEELTWGAAEIHFATTAISLYINDLPTVLCNISVQVPFADDTSVIITNINVFHTVLYCLIFML